ncbi:RpnC/YadD family protein [Sphingobacterium pedocola]|uniref:Transposase (putative) YhgA-like domain-containing protein n=1 Tax=Sphingobacterium pedocola TaxID=2082722 RepID=A0ABR9T3V8_9SPHI|nr:hypothetical protein [Sphingobacterium pedocola]MBE8719734.1 hypothetical protein [Sphingobacterium pedocola]
MSRPSRRIDDPLWKSIIEQTFVHFLSFFFPDADDIFDLNRECEYLDKEFESLFPPEPNNKGVRYVDKLVKAYLHDGSEQFVLCHIEVQSSKGTGDLAQRMFEYFYKISDKYKVPVTALAILADGNKSYRPAIYVQEFMGTSLSYRFNSYKILDQDETVLRADSNPFAVVVLTALMAILHRNVTDEQLKEIKHDLYEEMIKREMSKDTRQGIYDFLARYVSFQKPEMFINFEKEVETKLGRNTTMGTREYLLEKAKNEGLEKGKLVERAKSEKLLEQERAKAEAEKLDSALEFKKLGVPDADIAKALGLSMDQVKAL